MRGRDQVTGQLALAKLIGRFAVSRGQIEARHVASRLVASAGTVAERMGVIPPGSTGRPPATDRWEPAAAGHRNGHSSAPADARPSAGSAAPGATVAADHDAAVATATTTATTAGPVDPPSPDAGRAARRRGGSDTTVVAADLAIPGYDTLAATQVVPRLAGLSPAELDAVGRYEEAHRSRRTILARVAQLRAGG